MDCPFCDKPAEWVSNDAVYGRKFGTSYMIWLCRPCHAYVGCHNNTKTPLGTMADAATREARREAHKCIDPIWKSEQLKRKEVYRILRKHYGHEVHVGEMSVDQCRELIEDVSQDIDWPVIDWSLVEGIH